MSTVTGTNPNPAVFASRWGFHPCDRQSLLEIKEYHRLLLRDVAATRRYERWEARLPHNRVRRTRDGSLVPAPAPRCVGTDRRTYLWVLGEYREARKPAATAEAVRPLDLPRNWRAGFDALREFYREDT
jgi:hypothetical protein